MKKILIATFVALMASVSMADLMQINAQGSDRWMQYTNSLNSVYMRNITDTTARIGEYASGGNYNFYVVPFQLPVLPSGHSVTNASLNIYVTASSFFSNLGQSLSVYGVRTDSSTNVVVTDNIGGTLMGGGLISYGNSPLTPTGATNLTAAGFASYIQSIYDNDVNAAGKYVFLRLENDGGTLANTTHYITVGTANNATVAYRPVLNISTATIPEPATVGMLGLGTLITLLVRRIRTR